jgi:hypothetical protein
MELCALATTGSLSAEERNRLQEHLAGCNSCREIMAQYEAIVGGTIPAWAPDLPEKRTVPSWDPEQAEARLFARLNQESGASGTYEFKPIPEQPESLASASLSKSSGQALWGHLWGQFAAAALLVAALGLIAYRIGIRKGSDLSARVVTPAVSSSSATSPALAEAPTAKPSSSSADQSRELLALRSELEKRLAEIERLKSQQSRAEDELREEQTDLIKIAQDRAALAQELAVAQGNLIATQQKLDSATNRSSQDIARDLALQQRVDELTESLRGRDQEIARERELLDHDRDIRELMGSRDLYMAEVYDVDKTGDTQKPFGRVFYTSGKSLIFYAYDLDQQHGIERASTFQAWGRVGPDRERAVNLGILYQDNSNKKRWVVKSDNPKTLAQIDAVFVTVEPHGGSPRPSGKPLLFAYLRVQPNHP